MSPDLERLLEALYWQDTCEPEFRAQAAASVNRLLDEALSKVPGASREQFLDAVRMRYHQFRRARRKYTTLPPTA